MASVRLPWELMEEILSRVPPNSLVRFRTVCKQWNALFHEKSFLKAQLDHSGPKILVFHQYKIFSINVDLNDITIKVREICVDIPGLNNRLTTTITYCDGLLISKFFMDGTVVWNPLLRQGRQIMAQYQHRYKLCGIGYDNSRPEISYKILGYHYYDSKRSQDCKLAIYEFASDTWKYINAPYEELPIKEPLDIHMSLNGNSYWTAYNIDTGEYFIRKFDFSKELLKNFCTLPCKKNHEGDTHSLSIFRGNRFSMLEQCYRTREIEIWVTKKKIKNGDEEDVGWIKFMTVSAPDIPRLYKESHGRCPTYYGSRPSYFVDNIYGKSFVMCYYDFESCHLCLYIVKGGVPRKIKIDSADDCHDHCIYVPSMIPLPGIVQNKITRIRSLSSHLHPKK